jgi:hypothetical protein
MTPEPLLFRIRALLANAEDPGNPPEAQKSYLAKASELMAKYAIDEALLAGSAPIDPGAMEARIIKLRKGPYLGANLVLLSAICSVHNVRTVRWPVMAGETRVELFGFASDVAFAERLYTSCLLQANTELAGPEIAARMAAECSHGAHKVAWRNAFIKGFTTEILDRLIEAKRNAEAAAKAETVAAGGTSTSVALALVDRTKAVDAEYRRRHPYLRSGGGSLGGSGRGSGSSMGRQAGRRADIGNKRVASRPAIGAGS